MGHVQRVVRAFQEIMAHTIVTVALLVSFRIVEYVFDFLWGKDVLFLNLVPFKWIIQVADLSIYVSFAYVGVRSLLKAYKE